MKTLITLILSISLLTIGCTKKQEIKPSTNTTLVSQYDGTYVLQNNTLQYERDTITIQTTSFISMRSLSYYDNYYVSVTINDIGNITLPHHVCVGNSAFYMIGTGQITSTGMIMNWKLRYASNDSIKDSYSSTYVKL